VSAAKENVSVDRSLEQELDPFVRWMKEYDIWLVRFRESALSLID